MIYPTEVELAIRRFERKVAGYLTAHDKIALIPMLFLAFFVAYLTKIRIDGILENESELVMNGQFFTARVGRYSFLLLIGLSFFSYFVTPRFRKGFNAAVTLFAWVFNCYILFYHRLHPETFSLLLFGVPSVILLAYSILGFADRPELCKRMMIGFTVFCFVLYFTVLYMLREAPRETAFHGFLKLKMHYLLFLTWMFFLASKYMKIDRHVLLSPVNVTKAVLWPPDTKLELSSHQETKGIWWQGILNILVGYALLQLRFVWNDFYFMLESASFPRSFIGFTLAVLADVGIFNIVVGLARLFAFRARDATNFVWLARSPADYWRRGSVYHYEFVQRYIFVPLLRFTQKPILVTFATFFVFYLMKNGAFTTFGLIFSNLGLIEAPDFLSKSPQRFLLLHFIFQFILLIIAQRWWFGHKRNGGPWMSWLTIAFTYFLNTAIIVLAHKVLSALRTLG